MDTQLARQNVARYRHDLLNHPEDEKHPTLLRLLIAEEELLGRSQEQLDEMNRQIAQIKDIVLTQLETIALLKMNGHPLDQAEQRLYNLMDILIAHQSQRQKIEAAMGAALPK